MPQSANLKHAFAERMRRPVLHRHSNTTVGEHPVAHMRAELSCGHANRTYKRWRQFAGERPEVRGLLELRESASDLACLVHDTVDNFAHRKDIVDEPC